MGTVPLVRVVVETRKKPHPAFPSTLSHGQNIKPVHLAVQHTFFQWAIPFNDRMWRANQLPTVVSFNININNIHGGLLTVQGVIYIMVFGRFPSTPPPVWSLNGIVQCGSD